MWGRGANPKSYPSGYGYVSSAVVSASRKSQLCPRPAPNASATTLLGSGEPHFVIPSIASPFRSFSHRIVSLSGCDFIDYSREVIDLNEFVIPTGAKRSGGTCGFFLVLPQNRHPACPGLPWESL